MATRTTAGDFIVIDTSHYIPGTGDVAAIASIRRKYVLCILTCCYGIIVAAGAATINHAVINPGYR